MIQKQLDGSPAGVILVLLQRKGALTVKELEKGLGVTATAVRQQVATLLAESYIEQRLQMIIPLLQAPKASAASQGGGARPTARRRLLAGPRR